MKKILSFCLTAVFMLFLMGATSAEEISPSHKAATKVTLTKQDMDTLVANFENDGIDSKIQKKLIEKLKNGEVWDSMNPDMKDKAKVTSYNYKDKKTGVPVSKKIVTFPDGSYFIDSISGGWSQCGSGYCNYYDRKVYKSDGQVTAEYLADYTIVQGGKDYIREVDQERITTVGGVPDNISLTIKYATEGQVGSVPATAYLKFQKNTSGVYSSTYYLYLYVALDQARESGW